MGSFNFTCHASGMAIGYNDQATIFFIVENPFPSWVLCYPTARWWFGSFPLRATYNDYGKFTVNPESQPEYQMFKRSMIERLVPMEAGENEIHEMAVTARTIADEEAFIDAMIHGRVFIKGMGPRQSRYGWPEKVMVHMIAVHQDIYDGLMKMKFGWHRNLDLDARKADLEPDFMMGLDHISSRIGSGVESCDAMFGSMSSIRNLINTVGKKRALELVSEHQQYALAIDSLRIMLNPVMTSGQDYFDEEVAEFHEMCAQTARVRIKENCEDD